MSSTNNKNKPNSTLKSIQRSLNTARTSTSKSSRQQTNQKRTNSSSNSTEQKKKKLLFVSNNRFAVQETDKVFDIDIIEKTSEKTKPQLNKKYIPHYQHL